MKLRTRVKKLFGGGKKVEKKGSDEKTDKKTGEQVIVKGLKDYAASQYEFRISKVDGSVTGYIEKIDGNVVDPYGSIEDYLKSQHGGGRFVVTVIDKKEANKQVDSYYLNIAGSSKLDEEVAKAQRLHVEDIRDDMPAWAKTLTDEVKDIKKEKEEAEKAKSSQTVVDVLGKIAPSLFEKLTTKENIVETISAVSAMMGNMMKTQQEMVTSMQPAPALNPEMFAGGGGGGTDKFLESLVTTLGPLAAQLMTQKMGNVPQAPMGMPPSGLTPEGRQPTTTPQAQQPQATQTAETKGHESLQETQQIAQLAFNRIWEGIAQEIVNNAPPEQVADVFLQGAASADILGLSEVPEFQMFVNQPIQAFDKFAHLLQAPKEYKQAIRDAIAKQLQEVMSEQLGIVPTPQVEPMPQVELTPEEEPQIEQEPVIIETLAQLEQTPEPTAQEPIPEAPTEDISQVPSEEPMEERAE